MTNLDSILKSRDNYFASKGPSSQGYGFSTSHVWMWELSHKEGWLPKDYPLNCGVGRRLLSVPWASRRSQPVNPKRNQSWIFIGRTDAEAPIFCPPDVKNWLIKKDPDPGKDWRQEKGMTEDEMVGWHQWLNGHEFEQALGDGEWRGSLVCCSPLCHKESEMTEWQNIINTEVDEPRAYCT